MRILLICSLMTPYSVNAHHLHLDLLLLVVLCSKNMYYYIFLISPIEYAFQLINQWEYRNMFDSIYNNINIHNIIIYNIQSSLVSVLLFIYTVLRIIFLRKPEWFMWMFGSALSNFTLYTILDSKPWFLMWETGANLLSFTKMHTIWTTFSVKIIDTCYVH